MTLPLAPAAIVPAKVSVFFERLKTALPSFGNEALRRGRRRRGRRRGGGDGRRRGRRRGRRAVGVGVAVAVGWVAVAVAVAVTVRSVSRPTRSILPDIAGLCAVQMNVYVPGVSNVHVPVHDAGSGSPAGAEPCR